MDGRLKRGSIIVEWSPKGNGGDRSDSPRDPTFGEGVLFATLTQANDRPAALPGVLGEDRVGIHRHRIADPAEEG